MGAVLSLTTACPALRGSHQLQSSVLDGGVDRSGGSRGRVHTSWGVTSPLVVEALCAHGNGVPETGPCESGRR